MPLRRLLSEGLSILTAELKNGIHVSEPPVHTGAMDCMSRCWTHTHAVTRGLAFFQTPTLQNLGGKLRSCLAPPLSTAAQRLQVKTSLANFLEPFIFKTRAAAVTLSPAVHQSPLPVLLLHCFFVSNPVPPPSSPYRMRRLAAPPPPQALHPLLIKSQPDYLHAVALFSFPLQLLSQSAACSTPPSRCWACCLR